MWIILILVIIIIGILNSVCKLQIKNVKFSLPKVNGEKLKDKICNVEIDFNKNNFDFDLRLIKTLKEIDAKLEDLNLKIYIGTEDAAVTVIIVGIIWEIISNLLRSRTKHNVENKYFVESVYIQKNLLKINLNGIFKIKMRNIIVMIIKK